MPIQLDEHQFQQAIHTVRYQPGYIMWKAKDLTYSAINDFSAKLLGFKHSDEFIGSTDYDTKIEAPDSLREEVRNHTIQLFNEKNDRKWVQFIPTSTGVKLMYGSDTLILNKNNEPMATIITATDISDNPILSYGALLHPIIKEKIKKREFFILHLSDRYQRLTLGKRQSQCLYLLMCGLSIKEIAIKMGISPRTAETHLERIKEVLQTKNKSQLIEKAIEMNLIDYLIV